MDASLKWWYQHIINSNDKCSPTPDFLIAELGPQKCWKTFFGFLCLWFIKPNLFKLSHSVKTFLIKLWFLLASSMLIRNPTNQDPARLWFLHQISNLQAEPEFHRATEKKLQAVSISSENGWLEDSFPFGARLIFRSVCELLVLGEFSWWNSCQSTSHIANMSWPSPAIHGAQCRLWLLPWFRW